MITTTTWSAPAAPFGPGVLAARPYPTVLGPEAATERCTGAPFAGLSAIRLRGLLAAAGTTGSHTTGVAPMWATVQLNSTTPGELPPRDPLS